ncbi:MAG: putative HTH-type transcriptional regulator YurK [Anaerolineae bacterium]|nr:putative HTH-type transcriptional regulator YurK [Anaerolineae bacterium]
MLRKNVPLTSQVLTEILTLIEQGEFVSDNGEIPSEDELSRRFGVSRTTVREALAKLELGGVVIRRHGVGTYVSPVLTAHPGAVRVWLDDAPNFMDLIQQEGGQADCTLVDISLTQAGPLAGPLEIQPDSQLIAIERIFRSDLVPVIHSTNYVACDLIDPHSPETVFAAYNCGESVYDFLEQWCQRKVFNQKSEIGAIAANDRLAAQLGCSPGDPLLWVEEIGYGKKLRPLFYGLNHFRADLVSFTEMRHPSMWLRKSR